MNLSAPFINRPVMTTLVMVGILFFGILAYNLLPISDLPNYASPTIQVTAQNPGSDAELMAATVATTLEKQLMTVPGLSSVLSQSMTSYTTITLDFDLDVDIDQAMNDVAAALTRAQGDLPKTMPNPPTYRRYNPAASPVIFVAASSESMTVPDLYDYANTAVAQRMSMVNGVSMVNVYGSKRAVRIKLNPEKLRALGLGIDEVANACNDANQNLPGGTVYGAFNSYTLNPLGQMESGAAYRDLIIAYKDGAPVRIEDIGTAIDGTEDDNFFMKYWTAEGGEIPAVVLAVTKESGYNTVKICETITSLLPSMKKTIPAAIDLSVIFDSSVLIKQGVAEVETTLIIAFCLVAFVIFAFLGRVTATIIPLLSLPMSIIGTFMLMYILGYSLDILSLLALVLVVGFLVDDAIVVLENIVRHIEMEKTSKQAALDGSAQISTTVLSMSLSLAAVFIPFVFMPGIIGRIFHEFAMVVVISVLFSGIISLTLTPMLCSRFIKSDTKETWLERVANRLFRFCLKFYIPSLLWVLRHRLVPFALVVVSCVIAGILFFSIPQDFLPPGDTGVVEGTTFASQAVSPFQMISLQEEVTNRAKENPNVASIMSMANMSEFLPANQGLIFLNLKPIKDRQPISKVVKEATNSVKDLPGINTYYKPRPELNLTVGTGLTRANYSYFLSTIQDPDTLYESVEKMTEKMREIPELTNVSSDVEISTPMLNMHLLRDEARSFGISAETIERGLGLAYGGMQLATYSTQIDTYWIILELLDEFKKDPASLDLLYLSSPAGPQSTESTRINNLIPLRSVAKWNLTSGPLTVNHVNQFVSGTIYFDLAPNAPLGTAVKKIDALAKDLVPTGVISDFQGAAQVFTGTMGALIALIFVGIFTIYMLLGILYESFIHPLTILSALPGGLFGALITLFIFGENLSLYAYVGMIVLIGIIMKNGIMLVEFANELIEQGETAFEAISRASMIRFRPILMTTIAAAMGAVPIAIGAGGDASTRRPMGLAIVGGLIIAQFITYYFTPIVYLTFQNIQARTTRRRSKEKPLEGQ